MVSETHEPSTPIGEAFMRYFECLKGILDKANAAEIHLPTLRCYTDTIQIGTLLLDIRDGPDLKRRMADHSTLHDGILCTPDEKSRLQTLWGRLESLARAEEPRP